MIMAAFTPIAFNTGLKGGVQVKPFTAFVRVTRAAGVAPSGWLGDYVEAVVSAADVKPGQWVTVAVEGGTRGLTAVKVIVLDTSEP